MDDESEKKSHFVALKYTSVVQVKFSRVLPGCSLQGENYNQLANQQLDYKKYFSRIFFFFKMGEVTQGVKWYSFKCIYIKSEKSLPHHQRNEINHTTVTCSPESSSWMVSGWNMIQYEKSDMSLGRRKFIGYRKLPKQIK